jgi:hypothetical protein
MSSKKGVYYVSTVCQICYFTGFALPSMSEPLLVWGGAPSVVPCGLESVPSSFEQLAFGDGVMVDDERVAIQVYD